MWNKTTILRAEQSRAEQSRAQAITAPFLRPADARRIELNMMIADNRRILTG